MDKWGSEENAELGETVLGGHRVCGHDESSFQLPAAEMRAASDIQDVHSDGRRCERTRGPSHSIRRGLRDGARAASGIFDLIPKWEGR